MDLPLLIANWKMNANTVFVDKFLADMAHCDAWSGLADWVICPPFPYLLRFGDSLKSFGVALGGQDVSAHSQGAYTGDVAADMLKDVGCAFVIIGHSERRQWLGETSLHCYEKIQTSLQAGLTPIYCVGESYEQRCANQLRICLKEQLGVLNKLSVQELSQCVLAYEPVWAIGTGEVASIEQINAAHAEIRAIISEFDQGLAETTKILYGGSVKPENASALFDSNQVNGFLVGGASLEADSFYNIGIACSRSY